MTTLGLMVLILAALPAAMTFINLWVLRTPGLPGARPSIAILVPARDEAATIGPCVDAALASVGADIEVIVLDDASQDGTAAIVHARAERDARLRLETAPPLPRGWSGKQHACHVLSTLTDRPVLLFIDADVRLAPEGAARLALGLESSDLVSGVPRQVMASWLERAVVPMINALILGYLPILAMRWFSAAGFAAACGQLVMVRRGAYRAAGGHAAIRYSLHDGLKLPRAFRRAGLRTDLVDGSKLATCRMYAGAAAVWRGFLKNATEGMATPVALPVWTVLLLGGHVLPWLLLAWAMIARDSTLAWQNALACVLPITARMAQVLRFGEPITSVLLHPVGILVTLAIQWTALARRLLGLRSTWRGRAYASGT